jgi:hypothetical protein
VYLRPNVVLNFFPIPFLFRTEIQILNSVVRLFTSNFKSTITYIQENTSMRSVSAILFALVAGIASAIVFPTKALSQSGGVAAEDLARSADVVVIGKVTEVRSEWSADRSRIYSKVTLRVDEHIKGDDPGEAVVVTTLGGEIDGLGEVYSHTARFKPDEQVVVFGAKDQRGELMVVGGDEGKLIVKRDETTGLQMVSDSEPLGVFAARLRRIVQAQNRGE